MSTPEDRVKELVKRTIDKNFPDAYRFMPVQNGMGVPGLDFFYCIEGRFIAIETKKPGGKPTPRQWQTMQEVARAGGRSFVVDGPDSLKGMMGELCELLVLVPCR
jgi:VRR-NUC domain